MSFILLMLSIGLTVIVGLARLILMPIDQLPKQKPCLQDFRKGGYVPLADLSHRDLVVTDKENFRKPAAKIGFCHPQRRKDLRKMLASYRDQNKTS